ncbi:MAG: phospholipid/cholesterol/gamma-HCH transport system substrate-binding protein, partial [Thermoleophilaceae bacterium]|nr:phospholipid/cholesterol/gamma-HCH transport system substrate-binding protein [Thermoleophilaceae bacterium]
MRRVRVGHTDGAAPNGWGTARVATLLTLVVAAAFVGYLLLFEGGGGYTVKARFISGGQLNKGNLVEIAGVKVGTVHKLRLTGAGEAEAELEVDATYAPLPKGTRAVIRAGSQSSVANRYVDLHLPGARGPPGDIEDGGLIDASHTTTAVELDELFQTLDKPTRAALRGFHEGQSRAYLGRGEQANRGWLYLNPSLYQSSRLFRELSYDQPVLESFLVNSSRFVGALDDRRSDLSPLITNLSRTTGALAQEREALADAIGRLPDFLRTANSTYVNLRSALDDLEPFVEASKPVAKRLRPYLAELRPFARDAVPTVRDLRAVVHSPGPANDLRDLQQTYPPLTKIALDSAERNGKERRGAFPELIDALKGSAPIVAHGREYTVDLLGWFDDFSHTGAGDALGSFARVQTYVNAFSLSGPAPVLIPPELRGEAFKQLAKVNQ